MSLTIRRLHSLEPEQLSRLSELLLRFQPSVVLSVYPVYPYLIEAIFGEAKPTFRQVVCITDSITVNGIWSVAQQLDIRVFGDDADIVLKASLNAGTSMRLFAPDGTVRQDRKLFDIGEKAVTVVGNKLTIAGLGVLAISITGAMLLISDYLFNGWRVTVFTAVIGLVFLGLWALLPLYRRTQLRASER